MIKKILESIMLFFRKVAGIIYRYIISPLEKFITRFVPDHMAKAMTLTLVGLFILFGGIFAYKSFKNYMIGQFFLSQKNPTYTVSTIKAEYQIWKPSINAVGSTRTTLGVDVTAQIGGMIQRIYFTPGSIVEENTVLVQQNADPNIGQLHALEANAELAKITYERDKKQYRVKGISKQQLDSDLQNWKSLLGQVEQQKAIVQQLTIVAPFKGRLGVSKVNPGQFLNPGDPIVTLQSLDPIYVDFYLPQNELGNVEIGQDINITIDAFPGKNIVGKVTTINPVVEKDTRNVLVEATVPNPDLLLLPGMFTSVEVNRGIEQKLITLPKAAITFNPYGDLVYQVRKGEVDKKGKPTLIAKQKFVNVGQSKGDQVSIISGVNEGEEIVTSGQLKLKNGVTVAINNTVQPADTANPKVPNNHNE